MQIINGENLTSSNRTSTEYFFVNSCGIYKMISADIDVVRPFGRADYQFLYLYRGEGVYTSNQTAYPIHAGEFLLYRPGCPQRYHFFAASDPEIYWIHFTGTDVEKILSDCGFAVDALTGKIGDCEAIRYNIRCTAREIQLRQSGYNSLCCSYLISLLAQAGRLNQSKTSPQLSSKYEKLFPVIETMNSCLNDSSSIPEYAARCGLEPCYFISLFKEYTGLSPIAYRTVVKMNQARQLLSNTGLSIQEIAALLGYRDPLYFSRLFKKQIGLSPSLCRKKSSNLSFVNQTNDWDTPFSTN